MSRNRKLHVGVTFDAVAERVAEAWHRAEHGEMVEEDHLTFVTREALSRVMTSRRLELIRHLHRHPEASVAALARSLGRDYRRVHEDVAALAGAGLIERDEAGLRADYEEIRTVLALE
jgi:predicted transcriptional regulator